jgi:hypothetical protein
MSQFLAAQFMDYANQVAQAAHRRDVALWHSKRGLDIYHAAAAAALGVNPELARPFPGSQTTVIQTPPAEPPPAKPAPEQPAPPAPAKPTAAAPPAPKSSLLKAALAAAAIAAGLGLPVATYLGLSGQSAPIVPATAPAPLTFQRIDSRQLPDGTWQDFSTRPATADEVQGKIVPLSPPP